MKNTLIIVYNYICLNMKDWKSLINNYVFNRMETEYNKDGKSINKFNFKKPGF